MKGERVAGKMSSEKRQTTVVRRKKNGARPQNKELRQSMYDLTGSLNDMDIQERPACGLKRSRSFHIPEPQIHVQQKSAREILRQYVENMHDVDFDKIDHSDVPAEHEEGENPIHDAIEKDNIRDLAIYLVKNENLNIEQTNSFGQTPLIFAVSIGLVEVVKLLIASGAFVNCKDNYGVSALRYAVEEGDFEMASLLISHGANVESVQNGF